MPPLNLLPRRVLAAVLLSTLAIFGALVFGFTFELRGRLRDQVLRREAEAIHAVALMQIRSAEARLAEFGLGDAMQTLLFDAVLEASHLRGVMAVQLFDATGVLRQAMPTPVEDSATPPWWSRRPAGPEARFVRSGSLEMISPLLVTRAEGSTILPLLDVAVPLRGDATSAQFFGVARFWVDGRPLAAEFSRLNRGLAVQAGVAFAGGAVLLALVLAWAFSRLAEANRRLLEQRADLARANEELDFAAKTGALGAISAHLIHGLKNPLAGLEGFVAETATGASGAMHGEACRTAVETTRRLRALVNDVVSVLRDESAGEGEYRVPVAEIVEAARLRSVPLAAEAGVNLNAKAEADLQVNARTASLAGLVLANLIANAIEALPRGGRVIVDARQSSTGVEFLVSDNGHGLPDAIRPALFRPVRSSKAGGGGMGLAISLRLAKHAGGDLQLVRSDGQGTVFRLLVPCVAAPAAAATAARR